MRFTDGSKVAIGLAAVTLFTAPASAIDIVFDYSLDTGGFFATPANQARRDRLNQAAAVFEPFLDQLTAITPGGSNSWEAIIERPDTGAQHSISNPTIAANAIVVYAGARDISVLGIGGPGGYNASGFSAFLNTLATRGQGTTTGPTATDFGPWGGSITFDSNGRTWNFGTGNPTAGQDDFLSVAIHELAHVLGIGTADSWYSDVSGTNFIGPNATQSFGGPVPLNTAGDHFANGTLSLGNEAVMDPSLTTGTRKLFTPLDYAAMADVGWQIPEPSGMALVLVTAAGLLSRRRRPASISV